MWRVWVIGLLLVLCLFGVGADVDAAVLWSADHETGNFGQWFSVQGNSEGGIWNTGTGVAVISQDVARSGRNSIKMTISNADGQHGDQAVRVFRYKESMTNPEAYYSTWYYLPRAHTTPGGWWNIFQFKSKASATINDPFYFVELGSRTNGTMYVFVENWFTKQKWSNPQLNVPIGRWFQIEAYYKQSSSGTGRIIVWQDGVVVADVNNITNMYPNSQVHWSIANYTNHISPSTAVLYADDAMISTTRIGNGGSPTPSVAPRNFKQILVGWFGRSGDRNGDGVTTILDWLVVNDLL